MSEDIHERQRPVVLEAINAVADRIESEQDHLTELDSAIGDADHGANLTRGFSSVREELEEIEDEPIDAIVKEVGTTLISNVGGASGPLYGGTLLTASQELTDGITAESSVAFAEAYLAKVKDRGDATVGDKTMVDTLTPAVHTYKKSIEEDELPPLTALAKAVDAAERGVEYTVPLKAMKGRASFLGWRSVGHQDPGATSTLYILEELLAVAETHLEGETAVEAVAENVSETDESADDAEATDAEQR
ncbi:dihydroxyacetone kinase subunit DhaL [Haloquadratum walsbyi]|uniref:dihydroxyacetone kinase subunit DhaL n=1 Tax=Haloquadratum walsbyi TaxID=293091 RepID=UPI0015F54E17|nr:dihydroxyacetone kinase subunit DhaL [Haloquadratum walsbyi]